MAKKNSNIKLYASLGALLLVSVFGVGVFVQGYSGNTQVVVEGDYIEAQAPQFQEFGVAAGPEHTERQYFNSGFQDSDEVFSTTSIISTYTLLASEIDEATLIEWVPAQSLTLTMPASSTMYWLGETVGSHRTFWLKNSATSTDITISLTAGSGVGLAGSASSTNAISASSTLKLDFYRIPYVNDDSFGGSFTSSTHNVMLYVTEYDAW